MSTGTFGWAIKQMHDGAKVSRAGWNGKGMWVALTPGSVIPIESAKPEGAIAHLVRSLTITPGTQQSVTIGAHIDMKAVDGSLVIGWLASQTDMLATDWGVVP